MNSFETRLFFVGNSKFPSHFVSFSLVVLLTDYCFLGGFFFQQSCFLGMGICHVTCSVCCPYLLFPFLLAPYVAETRRPVCYFLFFLLARKGRGLSPDCSWFACFAFVCGGVYSKQDFMVSFFYRLYSCTIHPPCSG